MTNSEPGGIVRKKGGYSDDANDFNHTRDSLGNPVSGRKRGLGLGNFLFSGRSGRAAVLPARIDRLGNFLGGRRHVRGNLPAAEPYVNTGTTSPHVHLERYIRLIRTSRSDRSRTARHSGDDSSADSAADRSRRRRSCLLPPRPSTPIKKGGRHQPPLFSLDRGELQLQFLSAHLLFDPVFCVKRITPADKSAVLKNERHALILSREAVHPDRLDKIVPDIRSRKSLI